MADCGVCIGGYDGDEATFYNERIAKARKAHRCYECRDEIAIGTEYELVSGKWEGLVESYHFCLQCSEIGKTFSCNGKRMFGSLWSDLEDVFDELTTGCLDELITAAAKQKLMDRWRAWKFHEQATK